MNKVIVNVFGNDSVHLTCMKCGNSKDIPVKSFSVDETQYRIICKCGYSYIIILERRSFNRKTTDLRGTYSEENSVTEEIVDIVDLSTTGLGLVRRDNRVITEGQIINIRFSLDTPSRDEIKCRATIRQVNDEKVGVEFLDLSPAMQRILGFYLFNYVNKDNRIQEINFPILPEG